MRSASKRPFLLHLKVTTAPKPGCRAHLQGCPFHHPSKDLSLPPRHCWGKLRQERTGMAGWWYQTHPWGHPCRSGRNQPISHSSGGTCCQQCSQTCGRAMLPGDGHTGVPLTLWCARVCPPYTPLAALSVEAQGRGCTFLLPARPSVHLPLSPAKNVGSCLHTEDDKEQEKDQREFE